MSPAKERLIESRDRLRRWSGLKPAAPPAPHDAGRSTRGDSERGSSARTRDPVSGSTGPSSAAPADGGLHRDSSRSEAPASTLAGTLFEALRAWWSVQPLSGTVKLANDVAREAIAPYARKHPLALVGGAVAVGALIGALQPWRLIQATRAPVPVTPGILSHLVAQMPLQSLLAVMSAFLVAQAAADNSAADVEGADVRDEEVREGTRDVDDSSLQDAPRRAHA